jgi:hypothetical protein
LFRIQQLQRPNAFLKVLELLDDLLGTVVLLLFPVLKSLYSSKSLGRPNWNNRVQIIVRDLLLDDRVARSDVLKQLFLVEIVLNLIGGWVYVFLYWDRLFNPPLIFKMPQGGRDLLDRC